jgi:hypothetical protein
MYYFPLGFSSCSTSKALSNQGSGCDFCDDDWFTETSVLHQRDFGVRTTWNLHPEVSAEAVSVMLVRVRKEFALHFLT